MDMLIFFVFSWSFILSVSSHEKCRTASMCLERDGGEKSTFCNPLMLSCDKGEIIMLINTTLYVHNNKDDKICTLCQTNDTTELVADDEEYMKVQYQLYQTCSYQKNCTLSGDFPFKSRELGDKHIWYIVIDYCCVAQDIIHDGCAEWTEKVGDKPIHIVTPHNQTTYELSSTSNQCYCTIQGEAVLRLVEYTPCGNYDKCVEDYSLIYINGKEHFDECWTKCENTVYFNERLPDTHPMTNTVNITRVHQKMIFWYLVERNSSANVPVVSCNTPSLTSTSKTTVTSSKTSTTSTAVTEVLPTSSSNSANRTATSSSTPVTKLTGTTEADAERFPVGAVVGGLLGVIAVAVLLVVAVFIYRRSQSDKGLAEDNSQHNPVQFQQNSNGLANNAYVETNIIPDNNNGNVVYATVDKSRKKIEGMTGYALDVTYADTYEDNYSTTSVSHVPDQDVSMYNTFTESDEYSHIQTSKPAPTVPSLDNYSHITLPVNSTSATSQDDTYNHITLNTGTNNPESEIYYNVEP